MRGLSSRLFVAAAWLGLLALGPATGWAAKAGDGGPSDPHWNKNGCPSCHLDAAVGSPNAALKAESAEPLCAGCHGDGDAKLCGHASDLPAGSFLEEMPQSYQAKLSGGNVVCTTCHDLAVQCLNPKKSQRYKNPGFVRDGRFNDISEQCFLCHDTKGFKQISPHMQVRGKDKIKEGTCLLCHRTMPQQAQDGTWRPVDYNMEDDLNNVCRGCHRVRSHPSVGFGDMKEWAHLSVPPVKIGEKMRKTAADTGAILPLDPNNGRVFCGTCHNAHDKKLAGYPVAAEPGSRLKLRIDTMCGACHEK